MTTLVIDRKTLPETLFPLIGANRIRVESEADRVVLTPETEEDEDNCGYIDPDDYPDTTAYLNAIPGMAESLIALMNAPDSEFTEVPESWYDPMPQE